ncbi:MAG TPA: riboflavin synthase [Candidatus Nitrosocosmicus sp.]|nr:riboflavin synthase [Candidatus Nitrosocosmicus sp.]
MFTGITEYLAVVEDINRSFLSKAGPYKNDTGRGNHHTEITIQLSESKSIKIGDSISINGVCLTVAQLKGTRATFQVIDETISKTNFIDLKKGDRVNIERSLKVGGRLEGHFVLGHVDGTGTIKKIERGEKGSKLRVKIENRKL